MENHTPVSLKGAALTTAEYCRNLQHIAHGGVVAGISFTGGEPTLNPDLPEIIAEARKWFKRVELTTNGRLLERHLPQIAPLLDVIKISLDAVDPAVSWAISRGKESDHGRAMEAIDAALSAGMCVGINFVAMRQNMGQLDSVIEFARRAGAGRSAPYVSVLDLYYTDEQRTFWQQEFLPLDSVVRDFRFRHGLSVVQDRYGCDIEWFDIDGVQVRFKSSSGGTYRGARCTACNQYCQEGFYGIKHSVEGWVTPCPNGRQEMGVHLAPDLSADEAHERLAPLFAELTATKRESDSLETFLARRAIVLKTNRVLPVLRGGPASA